MVGRERDERLGERDEGRDIYKTYPIVLSIHSFSSLLQTLDTCPVRQHIKLTQMLFFFAFHSSSVSNRSMGNFCNLSQNIYQSQNANENGFWHRTRFE